jgi:hypothetical protein
VIAPERPVEPEENGEGEEGERFVVTGFGLGTVFGDGQTDGGLLPEPSGQSELGATNAGELLERCLSG